MKAITKQESSRLETLEGVIRRGQQTFIEVGNALAEIRDSKLYRETHKTFEAYCQDQWGWTKSRANQFISAAETVEVLTTTVAKPAPTSERQVRPLTALKTSEEQYEAWTKAHEIAEEEDRPVTGELVKRVVNKMKKTELFTFLCAMAHIWMRPIGRIFVKRAFQFVPKWGHL